jgi:hypothetical protein
MPLYLLLHFLLHPVGTHIHHGNTTDGLGMIIGDGFVEIGIYENGKTKNWSIQSFPKEGSFYEEFQDDQESRFLKIEKNAAGDYQYDLKTGPHIQHGFFSKNDKKKMFNRLRGVLLKGSMRQAQGIELGTRIVREKAADFEIKIKIRRNGQAVFKESGKRRSAKNVHVSLI